MLGADMSSPVHILILSKSPTQELDDTTLTAEAEYSINFTKQEATVFYLLMEWKSSNSKQNILNYLIICCVWKIYPKIFQMII